MQITYEDAFPRTYAVRPFMPLGADHSWASFLDWADEETVLAFAATIGERQRVAAEQDVEWLEAISDAAVLDVNDRLRELESGGGDRDGCAWRSLLFLRFIISIAPMERLNGLGRRGPAHDWAFRGISTDHDTARRLNRGYAYLPLRQSSDPRISQAAMRSLPRWCTTFFLLARDAGLDPAIASVFANACWDELQGMLSLDGPGSPRLTREIFSALSSLASWAVAENHDRRDMWITDLEAHWLAGEIPRGAASVVAVNFITKANAVTKRGIAEWAATILHEFGDTLREHERLQYLVASVDTYEKWRANRAAILHEIAGLKDAAATAEQVGSSPMYALDARVDILKPLMRLLIIEEDLSGAMELLRAWYGRPGLEPCDDNVLLAHPAMSDGVAFLWPGRAHIRFGTHEEGHDVVVAALNRAMRIARSPDDNVQEHREGMTDYARGAELEAAMRGYYRPAELASKLNPIREPRSLVVFPSVSDPLQALLARETGWALPLEVSLAAPRPTRPVRRISVWAGYTQSTHFEVALLETFGALRDWTVEVFPGSDDGDAADFQAYYEQVDPDVLWVCGHGEFVPHRLADTGVVVATPRDERPDGRHDDVVLSMERIAGFAVPDGDRRLLVLNTCSGAATQGMAGMARIGLAQSLARPEQSVAGHLWPASAAVALAFGGLLASNLDGRRIETTFSDTLRELRDPAGIVGLIEARSGETFQGAFRIASSLDELDSILAWGCPVLLT